MGNELFTKYSIEKTPFLQTGFLSLWSVHYGEHKEKKEKVCIFIADKKNIKIKYPKKETRKEIISLLKKDPLTLVKYSHKNILKIVEPLVEDKSKMGFITEPFSNTLGGWCDKSSPSKLEIKQIISQIIEGIEFLNKHCLLVHNSLNPNSILITKNNTIKIGNFSLSQSQGNLLPYFFMEKDDFIIKHLSYISPEIILDKKVFFQSDTFSVGCLIFTMLKRYINDKNKNFLNFPKTIKQYREEVANYGSHFLKINFTKEDNNILNQLLQREPTERGTIESISKHQWFNDYKLKAISFIKNISEKNLEQSLKFLEKLPDNLILFENKIIEREILPSLLLILKNNSTNRDLVNSILPSIFTICDMPMIKVRFETKIWPNIKLLFKLSFLPATCLFFLINKMSFLGEKISKNEFESDYLHVICKSIDSNVQKLQISVIENVQYLSKKLSAEKFKAEIYERFIKILTNCNSNFIKVQILKNIHFFYEILDMEELNNSLLKKLAFIKVNEVNLEVCMGLVQIYEEIAKLVSVESIANKILPMLINILVTGNIDKNSFDKIMNLVLTYLNRIKESREKDLESVQSIAINNNQNENSYNSINHSQKSKKEVNTNFFEDFFNENINEKITTELNLLHEYQDLPVKDYDKNISITLKLRKNLKKGNDYTTISEPQNDDNIITNHQNQTNNLFDEDTKSQNDNIHEEEKIINYFTQSNHHDIMSCPQEEHIINQSVKHDLGTDPELLLDD